MASESTILGAMDSIRKRVKVESIYQVWGIDAYNEAVKRLQLEPTTGPTTRELLAKHAREKREHFKNLAIQGVKSYKASQQDHDHIMTYILSCVDRNNKPAVSMWLKLYGTQNGRDSKWAERVRTQTNSKRLNKTLAALSNHPVIIGLKAAGMFSQSHKGALTKSTYTGFSELLFSWNKAALERQQMLEYITALEMKVHIANTEATRAKVKMLKSEDWKVEALSLHSEGLSYKQIAEQVGKAKTVVYEHIKKSIVTILPID